MRNHMLLVVAAGTAALAGYSTTSLREMAERAGWELSESTAMGDHLYCEEDLAEQRQLEELVRRYCNLVQEVLQRR